MNYRVCLALSLTVTAMVSQLDAQDLILTGVAHVVDGDTIVVGEKRIRLEGIDAPETDQLCLDARGERWTCGIAARDLFHRMSPGASFRVHRVGRIATDEH